MKTAIFLYEPSQLASLDAIIARLDKEGREPQIVSLDAEIDFALEKRGVPFISGKTLQNRTAPSTSMRADEVTRALYDHEAMSFLKYRNVSLIDSLRFSTQIYILHIFNYIDIIERFMDSTVGIDHMLVPVSIAQASKTSDALTVEESKVVYEAAHLVAKQRGILCELYDTRSSALQVKDYLQELSFAFKRALFGVALSSLNTLMALRSRRKIRIIASDYWHSLAPILHHLPDAELVLVDRKEALKAGLGNIWRYKMRFLHIKHFLSLAGKRLALAYAEKCKKEWRIVRKEILQSIDFTFCGADFSTTAERIMIHLIETAVPDVICDIEGAYAMYEHLSPDTVLLRASASRQRHFSVLPLVAREMGIPAIEVQHGGEYLGPSSGTRRHAAHFLATYGPLVCDEFRALGYEPERLLPIGSPRFDAYMRDAQKAIAREEKSDLTILSNTPTMDINERYGTYSIEEYFKTLGGAVRDISNARLLVASRSTTTRAEFLEEARERGFTGVNYENVGTTPLPELFRQADIFVCSYSTVVYEALLYRLPVILAVFAPVEKMMADFHFSRFQDADALLIAHSPEELTDMLKKLSADKDMRESMNKAGWEFMQKNFSFDGHASKRVADFIRAHS